MTLFYFDYFFSDEGQEFMNKYRQYLTDDEPTITPENSEPLNDVTTVNSDVESVEIRPEEPSEE